jgi:segregation and condensation protein B
VGENGEETKHDTPAPSAPPPANEERVVEGESFSDEDPALSGPVVAPEEQAPTSASEEPAAEAEHAPESATHDASGAPEVPDEGGAPDNRIVEQPWHGGDVEQTINLSGDLFPLPGRDDLDDPTQTTLPDDLDSSLRAREAGNVARTHLKGLLEALIFASDSPIKANELAKSAAAPSEDVKHLLGQLKEEYTTRGMQLAEVAGGWSFRTNASYAPFVRDLTKQKPVKLSRAQIETLAILAYRQPITRPEIDEIRGVDSGATLKMLLERDVVKILGKKDEPGRPLLYGTTTAFLELFSLKSLKELPTLREFTELNEDSRRVVERELGETMAEAQEGEAGSPDATATPAEKVDPRSLEEDDYQPPPADADPAAAEPVDDVEPMQAAEDPPAEAEETGETGDADQSEDEDEDDEPDSDDFDDDDDDDDDDDEDDEDEDEDEDEKEEKPE